MPIFHTTLFFAQPPLSGWVEQFWWEGADQNGALLAAADLARARYTLIGAGVVLTHLRVSAPDNPRTSVSTLISGQAIPFPAMPACQCAEVRVLGHGIRTARRAYKLGGLPLNALVVANDQVQWAPYLAVLAQRYLAKLTSGGWRLLAEVPAGPQVAIQGIAEVIVDGGDPFGGPVQGVEPDPAAAMVYCQMTAAPTLPADSARLWGAQMVPRTNRAQRAVNGTHTLTSWDAQGVYWQGTFEGYIYLGGGSVQLYSTDIVPITQAELVRLASRKVGPAKKPGPTTLSLGAILPLPATFPLGPGESPPSPVPPIVVTGEYQTMLDMVDEIFNGYVDEGKPEGPLMAIAQVQNTEQATYVVFLSGVDNQLYPNNIIQWFSGLQALLGFPDNFTNFVRTIIRENTPDGCQLIIAGHSLGAIAGQSLLGIRAELGMRKVQVVVGVGAPSLTYKPTRIIKFLLRKTGVGWLLSGEPAFPVHLFAVRGDLLPLLSPAGDWAWSRYFVALATGFTTEAVIAIENQVNPQNIKYVDPPILNPDNPWTRHNCYPRVGELADYNWNGTLDVDQTLPPLRTGVVKRFLWPSGQPVPPGPLP